MKKSISTFLKFGEKRHLEELRKGVLYMQPLSFFQRLELDEAKRSDRNEGLSGVYQPDKISVTISFDGQSHTLSDLAGPLLIANSALDDVHTFCLFALAPGEYEVEDTPYEDNMLKIKMAAELEKFGGHVLFTTNAQEFQERILRALKRHGRRARVGLVEYVDESSFHGDLDEEKIGFYKFNTFKNQKEYRILVHNSGKPNEPLHLNVGDLSDITEIIRWNELDIKIRKNT